MGRGWIPSSRQKAGAWRFQLAPYKRRSTGDHPGAVPCTDAGTGDRIQTPDPGSGAQRSSVKHSHTLPEAKLQEIFGSVGWKQLPDEVYKRVRVQPAVYTIEEHHVAVYAGKDNQTIVKADRPKELLRNSILTPSLLRSRYRRMGARQTVRVTCGSTGRERDMGILPLSCMNLN